MNDYSEEQFKELCKEKTVVIFKKDDITDIATYPIKYNSSFDSSFEKLPNFLEIVNKRYI